MQLKRILMRPYFLLFIAWLAGSLLFVGFTALNSIERAKTEVQATGAMLHRVLSQRAAQHDAHLTSLNALILAASPPPVDVLRQVARNIIRFYPRIAGIDVMLINQMGADFSTQTLLSVDEHLDASERGEFERKIAAQRPGIVQSYLNQNVPDRYFLGKKSDNSNPGYAILMEINPALMIEPDERPDWADLTLQIDGQTILSEPSASDIKASAYLQQPVFTQFIDSQNQPILLTLTRPMDLAEVVAPLKTLLFAVFSLLFLIAAYSLWRFIQSARRAEERAQLLEHETRLAHAARVNSMGELASGIAHELTQPLTALLSQSQAALRLSASGGQKQMLEQALNANIRQATRAGEILQRMRNYMSNQQPIRKSIKLNQIIRDVSELLKIDLAQCQITLKTEMFKPSPVIIADTVEVEQVLYNLIRNAADSLDDCEGDEKIITVSSAVRDGKVLLRVADNGRGIPEDVLPHLFEPFFTTRKNGTGLGLALCATLVERVDGEISAQNRPEGGAEFTIVIPEANYPH